MSDLLFPKLPGLTWEIKPVPTWPGTVKQRSKNNAVTTLSSDPYPVWTFELSYEFLGADAPARPGDPANPTNISDVERIVGFFNQMRGDFDTFLLDPSQLVGRRGMGSVMDTHARGVQIGVGDGTSTVFYLLREYGGFMDEVQNPLAGTLRIANNGVAVTSGWTLGDLGVVTFASAPASGHIITADFDWQLRMRFTDNSLDIDAFMYRLYELKSLKLEEAKL